MKANNTAQKVLFSLGWDVDELSRLIECARQILVDCQVLIEFLKDPLNDLQICNVPSHLAKLRTTLTNHVKILFRHYREAATHVFVLIDDQPPEA